MGSAEMSIDAWEGNTNTPVCGVWDGLLTGGLQPLVTLPHVIRAAIRLTNAQVVLLTEIGDVLLYNEGSVYPLQTSNVLPPVRDISSTNNSGSEPIGEDVHANLLCLLHNGEVLKVHLPGGKVERFDCPGSTGLTHHIHDHNRTLCVGSDGNVWSKGQVPFTGLLHHTDQFEKVSYFTGKRILQLESGLDFTVCVIQPIEDTGDLLSPTESVEKSSVVVDTPDVPSCPLGLALSPPSMSVKRTPNQTESGNEDCDVGVGVAIDSSDDSGLSLCSSYSMPSIARSSSRMDGKEDQRISPFPNDKCWSEPPLSAISPSSLALSTDDLEHLGNASSKNTPISVNKRLPFHGHKNHRTHNDEAASINNIIANSARLRTTEIWAWGSGSRGQLGQGDLLSRTNPVTVNLSQSSIMLHTSGASVFDHLVVKVSAGSRHTLALTGTGHVYGWGDNRRGQANPNDHLAVVAHPSRLMIPQGETVRDILAVDDVSVLISDTGNVFYTAGRAGRTNNNNNHSMNCIMPAELGLPASLQPNTVLRCGNLYLINVREMSPATCKIVTEEKRLLDQVETVSHLLSLINTSSNASTIVCPTQKTPNLHSCPLLEVGSSLEQVKHVLTVCTAQSAAIARASRAATAGIHRITGVYTHLTVWSHVNTELALNIANCISQDCLGLDANQSHLQPVIIDILSSKFGHLNQQQTEGATSKGEAPLEELLTELYQLSARYIKCLMELHKEVLDQQQLGEQEQQELLEKANSLMCLHQSINRIQLSAEKTRAFWSSVSGHRLAEFATEPARRLVLDSRYEPVALGGAMTRHWLVLLSDLLVDVSYSYRGVVVHPLLTVWVDSPVESGNSNKFEIILTMPEDTKTLVADNLEVKNRWLKALLIAIVGCARNATTGSTHPPVTRNVEYEFQKGEHRGARYKGSMTQAKMHGKGSLKYPDGSEYTGGWRNGIQHGHGIMTQSDGSTQEGTWRYGKLTGTGRLRFADGSIYEGDLMDGQPQGHGIRKEGKFMGLGASVYIGEWEKGARHGYGAMDDIMSGEKYMGMWSAGLRNGKGCVVNSDGIYYEGNFVANRLTGGGIMIFDDGSVYEGEFCGAGEFNGRGVLVSRTERFEGVFHGNYSDGMKFNGMVYRQTAFSSTELPDAVTDGRRQSSLKSHSLGRTSLSVKQPRHVVVNAVKWVSIFSKFDLLLGDERPWNQVAIAINQRKSTILGKDRMRLQQDLDFLETIPSIGQSTGSPLTWCEYQAILHYLTRASTCPVHPFNGIVEQLVQCFNASYGGVRSHPTLLPLAREELWSVAERLYDLVRRLFPALPDVSTHSQVWLSKPVDPQQQDDVVPDDNGVMITPSGLILPLLLPAVHPTLFHLYLQREKGLDTEYWARMLRWNKHTDAALLTFFDVDASVCDELLSVDRNSAGTSRRHGRDELFLDAVYSLQRLKTTFTPAEKLDVIVGMFKAITRETGAASHTWSMDSLLPVCMFVVVRARVLQLGAELAMLSDLMENYLFQGEKGIMFTTLQAAYTQILRENVFIN